MNIRQLAYGVLWEVTQNGAYSNIALSRAFSEDVSPRDRAFAANLVYGVIQQDLRLAYILKRYIKSKFAKIDPEVLVILKMAAYQMHFMDKVPQYAIVSESVSMTKRVKKSSAGGFVNGVLRAMMRDNDAIVYPKEELENLSVYYSYPKWFCKLIKEAYGDQTRTILQNGNLPPTNSVRVNTLLTTRDELMKQYEGAQKGKLSEDAVIFEKGFSYADDAGFLQGLYYPQDEAAMETAQMLAPISGQSVLDLCAAPGGKTTHMAQLMQNKGTITACDIYEHKLKLIQDASSRMKINIIDPVLADATIYRPEWENKFDCVLADVPCSGSGTLRRKPEIKWNMNEQGLDELCTQQAVILNNAARYVKPGGALVYSTCSILPQENKDIIATFFGSHGDCILQEEKQLLPESFDGFYMARLIKNKE